MDAGTEKCRWCRCRNSEGTWQRGQGPATWTRADGKVVSVVEEGEVFRKSRMLVRMSAKVGDAVWMDGKVMELWV